MSHRSQINTPVQGWNDLREMGPLWGQEEPGVTLVTLKATVQFVAALPFIKSSLERLVNTSVCISLAP